MSQGSRQIPLLLSMPQACSYLPQRLTSNLVVDPAIGVDMALYSQLIRQGFRRSGRILYRPHCEACRQCLSLRIPVGEFTPRRRHRRVMQRNRELVMNPCNARFQQAHFELYRRYTASRHSGGSMAGANPDEYLDFLTADWSNTLFLEMREQGRLLAVAVTDQVSDGLSAVYTFFEPELPQRSLGTFALLSQLELAAQLGLPHLYLGYWIRDCPKMAYKADYRPMQVFSEGRWRPFERHQAVEVPELTDINA
jgi:arginine-tRNA-protein transferase